MSQEVKREQQGEVEVTEVKPDAGAAAGEAQQPADDRGESLQRELEEARAQAQERWDQLLRAKAELDNIRRRAERDVENAHKYALERFAQELLPVRDSMRLGLAATDSEGLDIERFKEGSELTLRMLTTAMDKFGIQEINPEGEKFNPELHQAMSTQVVENMEPNRVVAVYQTGYMLNDRLLRPALVIVSAQNPTGPDAQRIDEHA